MALVKEVILGSSSVFRRQLLASTGLQFTWKSSPMDEKTITDSSPKFLAEKRSIAKASALGAEHPACIIIGADQTLSMGEQLFEKVENRSAARDCLKKLSGKTYYLHSGFCLVYQESGESSCVTLHKEVVDTPLALRALSVAEIEAYLDTGEWEGVVGCNRIEGLGIHLHDSTYPLNTHSIIGLPLVPLLSAFRKLGINPLTHPAPKWSIDLPI
ncbi:MAG: Maf family protein [Oligoflexales bacterium]|nr:Maf family protein [Oligoflexales bacterium]